MVPFVWGDTLLNEASLIIPPVLNFYAPLDPSLLVCGDFLIRVRIFGSGVFAPLPKTPFWSDISVRMETAQRALVDPAITGGKVLPTMLAKTAHSNTPLLKGNVPALKVLN